MVDTGYRRLTQDGMVSQASPTSNFDRKAYLYVRAAAASDAFYTYLAPARPTDITKSTNKILNAYLRLVQKGNWSHSFTLTVTLLSSSFRDDTLTWNNKPTVRAEGAASATFAIQGVAENTVFELDLAPLYEALVTNGWTYYGLRLTSNNTTAAQFFSEVDTGASSTVGDLSASPRGAKMKFVYTTRPARPQYLHPAAARSISAPRLSADTGNVQVESMQIQVSPSTDFNGRIRDVTLLPSDSLKRIDALLHNMLTPNKSNIETNTTGWYATATSIIARNTTEYYEGAASLQVTPSLAGEGCQTNPDFAQGIVVGAAYTASLYCKGTAGKTIRLRLQWYTNAQVYVNQATIDVVLTGVWQRITVANAIAPATTTCANLRVQNQTDTTDFYIDAIQLEQNKEVTAWVSGNPVYNTCDLNQSNIEKDTAGWATTGGGSPTIARTIAQKWEGTAGLQINPGAAGGGAITTAVFGIVGSRGYSVSAYIKGTAGKTIGLATHWYTAADVYISASAGTIVADGTWQRLTRNNVAAPANAARLRLILSNDTDTTVFYIDGIQIEEAATVGTWYAGQTACSFVPLTSNSTYYWRCRYTTPDGLVSSWSLVQVFQIMSKPTVNITAVTGGLTNDVTPTCTHTYVAGEGGAQKRWRVRIRRYDIKTGKWLIPFKDPKTGKWVNGWYTEQTGTGLTVAVPTGVLKSGNRYLQELFIWDTIVRDDDSTDKAYLYDSEQWRINTTTDTAPVGTLTVAQLTEPLSGATATVLERLTGNPPINLLQWTRTGTPDRFRIVRKADNDPSASWRIVADEVASEFDDPYSDGWLFYDPAPAGVGLTYKVFAISANKASQQTSYNPYFKVDLLDWTLYTGGGAACTTSRHYEANTSGFYFARLNITNGGSDSGDVQLYQVLPSLTSGTQVKVRLRMRSKEGNRNVVVRLHKHAADYTEYGTDTFEITSEWVTKSYTWTMSETAIPRLTVRVGNDTDDVDIDYFYASFYPVAEITNTTNGWWLVAKEDIELRIPLLINTGDIQIEWDEQRAELHPIGGKFVIIREPTAARKTRLEGWVDMNKHNYIDRLDRIRNRSMNCWLLSSKGESILVQIGEQSAEDIARQPGKKYMKVSLSTFEVDDNV